TAVSSKSAAWVLKNLPFVLFLGFLAIIYIANTHYAQRTVREIRVHQQGLRELRRVYNALNAEVMYYSKKSEIAKSVKGLGLAPSKTAPKKIIIEKQP
ncbi:MAG: FtsL-like putative cell division protein, partial [Bacteroidota bacterium]